MHPEESEVTPRAPKTPQFKVARERQKARLSHQLRQPARRVLQAFVVSTSRMLPETCHLNSIGGASISLVGARINISMRDQVGWVAYLSTKDI